MTKYSLVPEQVRVLSAPTLFSSLDDEMYPKDDECLSDDNFLKELRSLGEEDKSGTVKAEFQPPW
jgi:hypothetical protein